MFVMNHELKFHTTKLGELRSNLKSTKETEQRIASLRTKLDAVLQKERLYGILREGPGQKGARALLIDSAWPAISASINDILADTFGRGEATANLDGENAHLYLDMLRSVLTRANFHQVIYVSDKPEIAAQADATNRLASGASPLEAA